SRLVDTGQFVRAGQPLMTIDRTDYVHAITARAETVAAAKAKAVQAAADEARYRPLVKSGAVSASIYDQIKAASDAAQAELAAAAQTRTFEARYVLEGAAANAPLGATVTVHLSGDAGADTLQVPVASVLDRGKGPGIWLLNPSTSTVSFQPVQVRQLGEELAT